MKKIVNNISDKDDGNNTISKFARNKHCDTLLSNTEQLKDNVQIRGTVGVSAKSRKSGEWN